MKFRTRLQLFGIPLVVISIVATAGIHYSLVSKTVVDSKRELLSIKLNLLENRVSSSYDVLFKVGLQQDQFFLQNAREGVVRYFKSILSAGEEFLIFSNSGELLDGSVNVMGRERGIDDPLLRSISKGRGVVTLRSAFLPAPHSPYIVAHSYFEPLGWTLVVATDEALAYKSVWTAISASLVVSLFCVVAAAVGFMFIARRISLPLSKLTVLTRELAEGRFETGEDIQATISAGSSDEICTLTDEFKAMASRLSSLTKGLEARVAERTEDLERSNSRLASVNDDLSVAIQELRATQDHLVMAEKMAALGQLVAGIAHELNTPLGAIVSASHDLEQTVVGSLAELMELYRDLSVEETVPFRALVAKSIASSPISDTRYVREARWRLEKMLEEKGVTDSEEIAGKLVELDPHGDAAWLSCIASATGGTRLVDGAWQVASMNRSLRIIELAAEKTSKVVMSLKVYSHQEPSEELSLVDIREEIDVILTLYHNTLKYGVEVVCDYGDVPKVYARKDRLSQVWINLIDNAAQAMDYKGRLGISVQADAGMIAVSVCDSGGGIPESIKGKIFSPFFTTKKSGEGTGLGLSISKRIVEENKGTISFTSKPGSTVFTVRLPMITIAQSQDS